MFQLLRDIRCAVWLHVAVLRIIANTADSSYSHSQLGFILDVTHSLHAAHK